MGVGGVSGVSAVVLVGVFVVVVVVGVDETAFFEVVRGVLGCSTQDNFLGAPVQESFRPPLVFEFAF